MLAAMSLTAAPPAHAAFDYANGTYVNLCGTGMNATADMCNQGCSLQAGTCSSSSNAVVRYECEGRKSECRENESSFAPSQRIGSVACGKTVQIDIFDKVCRQNGTWTCGESNLKDYLVWYSGDCKQAPSITPVPSPTPAPSALPSPTPTTTPSTSSCVSLSITGGNESTVPATVTLKTDARDIDGQIRQYRYFFGDGTSQETSQPQIQHRYDVSGTFTARVEVQDSRNSWKSGDACIASVIVKNSILESHKAECSHVFLTKGNNTTAPTQTEQYVTGYDNKGAIQQYKIDYGDGTIIEQGTPRFTRAYERPGTYTIRGSIKDSEGNWKESDSCHATLTISTTPLHEQPKTGTPPIMTITGLVSGAITIIALRMRQLKFRS
jgi:hypothetical protein